MMLKLLTGRCWIFIGMTDAEAEAPVLWPPDEKNWLTGKKPWCWKRLRERGEGEDREWDDWLESPIQWTWVWTNLGSLACCSPWGPKESDITERLNNSNMAMITVWNLKIYAWFQILQLIKDHILTYEEINIFAILFK